MINIVKQKPLKRIRRRRLVSSNVRLKIPFKNILKGIFVFALIFSLIYLVIYVFRSTLFKSEYYIYNLRYSTESIATFDDPVLYRIIKNQVEGENYYVLKYFKRKHILSDLKSKFPIVEDIEFNYSQKNTLDIKVIFDDIDLRFKLGDNFWGLYDGHTFAIYSGNIIGDTSKTLELPGYLSGLDNLNGLFFDYNHNDLVLNVDILSQVFGHDVRLVYIPGSKRIGVFVGNNRVIYVNLQKDVRLQMTQYDFLRKNDPDFEKYSEIDFGSLEGNMVIIKK